MADIVSQAGIFISSKSQGAKKLLRVKTYDVSDDRDKEVVTAVGVKGGAGTRKKQGGISITLEVYRETTTKPECNWRFLRDEDEKFTLDIADEDGLTEQFQDVEVAKVEPKGDDAGSHMDSVKLIAQRSVVLPSKPTL